MNRDFTPPTNQPERSSTDHRRNTASYPVPDNTSQATSAADQPAINSDRIPQTDFSEHSDTEFAQNPEPRCPCVLVLDVSGSMSGPRMDTLNQSLLDFKQQISADHLTTLRAEIAIIAFSDQARVAQAFTPAADFNPPVLSVEGGTKMGNALVKALDMVEDRKAQYKLNGISYFRPIIMLITDGSPEHDTQEEIQTATQRVLAAENDRSASIFSFGIDDHADIRMISSMMPPHRPAIHLRTQHLSGLFQWLSASVTAVSSSQPGERLSLPDMNAYLQH